MQAYLTEIQSVLLLWYQLTLEHTLYAVCLALLVWLPLSFFYRLRLAMTQRKLAVQQRLATDAQSRLDHMQQEAQKLREELAAQRQQTETDRVNHVQTSQQLAVLQSTWTQRNQHLGENLRNLAFNLGLSAIPVTQPGDNDGLWQANTTSVMQLADRLRAELQAKNELQQAYQTLTQKLAASEAQTVQLEARLQAQAELRVQNPVVSAAPAAMPHHEIASLLAQYQLQEAKPSAVATPATATPEPAPSVPTPAPVVTPAQEAGTPPPLAVMPETATPLTAQPLVSSPAQPVAAPVESIAAAPAKKSGGLLGGLNRLRKTFQPESVPVTRPESSVAAQPVAPTPTSEAAVVAAQPVADLAVAPAVVAPVPEVALSVGIAPPPAAAPSPVSAATPATPAPATAGTAATPAAPAKKSGFLSKLANIHNALSPEYVPVTRMGKEARKQDKT